MGTLDYGQWEVAPKSEHVLDWFDIGMRFEHLGRLPSDPECSHGRACGGMSSPVGDRAKWALWKMAKRTRHRPVATKQPERMAA